MKNAKGPSKEPRLNLTELLSRVDNDRELLRDLPSIFKEDFPRHLQALQEAVERSDVKQVTTVSHTLKGMLSNLAVNRAAAAAGHLEQLARDEAKAALSDAFTAFEKEVYGLLPEMETYIVEVEP
jgi:HPt (histidine-containing phosphotransfer) domain-containing protein